jgi:UDP-glucose 4-epimerase
MRILPDRPVLVWGARGFIGRALVGHLLDRGWPVRVLTRRHVGPVPEWADAVEWIALNGVDRGCAYDRALDGVSVVFNLAGSSGAVASNDAPIDSLESNCRLQLEFLAACARTGRAPHVVFASSRLVYAPAGRAPITEQHPVAPLSIYAAHKLCVEHYHRIFAHRGKVTFTICRISNPFGLDESATQKGYGFINAIIQRALAGERLTLFGRGLQLRDYLYIDDLTAMLCRCAERHEARNEIVNVGHGHSLSISEAVTHIQRVFGSSAIDFQPWPREYEAVESGDFVVDISKARTLLACAPAYSFEGGLARIKAHITGRGASATAHTPPGAASASPMTTRS